MKANIIYSVITFFLAIAMFLAGMKAICAVLFAKQLHQLPFGIICISFAIGCVIHFSKKIDKATKSNYYQSRKTWEL